MLDQGKREPQNGTIIAAFGRQFLVEPDCNGEAINCVTRSKRTEFCVGDQVVFQTLEERTDGLGTGVIEKLVPRGNVLLRSDHRKQKLIAANVDQVILVIATEPSFSENLLGRMMMSAEHAEIPVLIWVSKWDLIRSDSIVHSRLDLYRQLGYQVITGNAKTDVPETQAILSPYLVGKQTLLLGQSGMGKSTLLNALVPSADQRTREISVALSSGRHTTTFSRRFPLDSAPPLSSEIVIKPAYLIDSPGLQTFGLSHLHPSEVQHAMPEIKAVLGQCRFRDCQHDQESDCAVTTSLSQGRIDRYRYQLLRDVLSDLAFYDKQF